MSVENCGAKQVEEGQVKQELNQAERGGSRLTARIDELEESLSIVLRKPNSPPPSLNKAEVADESLLVPLAQRIRAHSKDLHNQGTRLEGILDRLELR